MHNELEDKLPPEIIDAVLTAYESPSIEVQVGERTERISDLGTAASFLVRAALKETPKAVEACRVLCSISSPLVDFELALQRAIFHKNSLRRFHRYVKLGLQKKSALGFGDLPSRI